MLDLLASHVSPGQAAFLLAVAVAAGLARGFSGFGAALIFVPLASTAIGPKVAVPLLLVVDGLTSMGLVPPAFRAADRSNVAVMALGAAVGVPAGIYLLVQLDPLAIRWSMAVLVALLLVLLMSGWRYHGPPKAWLTVLVGAVSGLLSGAAQIGGPPAVAYWLGGAASAAVVRANIILFFAISTVLTGAGHLWGGLITVQVLVLALMVAPVYSLALWLGSRMFSLAGERMFRRVCYAMIAAAALLSLPLLDDLVR